jgi:hypothetical protein
MLDNAFLNGESKYVDVWNILTARYSRLESDMAQG